MRRSSSAPACDALIEEACAARDLDMLEGFDDPLCQEVRKLLADYLGARAQLKAIEEFAKLNVRPTGKKKGFSNQS